MRVVFNIPTEEKGNFVDFLCEVYDYSAQIYDPADLVTIIPNPETRIEFAKRNVTKPIKDGFDKWLIRKSVMASDITSKMTNEEVT